MSKGVSTWLGRAAAGLRSLTTGPSQPVDGQPPAATAQGGLENTDALPAGAEPTWMNSHAAKRLIAAEAGAHGTLRVVFACFRHAESRLDAVAGEAHHTALVGLHRRRHATQGAAEQIQRVLRVHAVGHGRGADHICEEHRHLAALQPRT